jgi:hypothetical protein
LRLCRRVCLLLGALPVTAALLSACSSTPAPLGNGGSPSAQCMFAVRGKTVTVGLFELTNIGKSPAVVQSVTLPAMRGLRMTKSWLVPVYRDPKNGNHLNVGAGFPYPPAWSSSVRRVWAQRRPAAGGTIRPGQDLNLVFGLTRTTAMTGKSAGPVIVYSTGGTKFTLKELTTLTVAGSCTT